MTRLDRVLQTVEGVEDYLTVVTISDFCRDIEELRNSVRSFTVKELKEMLSEILGDDGR